MAFHANFEQQEERFNNRPFVNVTHHAHVFMGHIFYINASRIATCPGKSICTPDTPKAQGPLGASRKCPSATKAVIDEDVLFWGVILNYTDY